MTQGKLAYREDCFINRDCENFPNSAVLFDGDGERLFVFPGNWSNEQIYTALAFANFAFNRGCCIGEDKKVSEFLNVFNLNPIKQIEAMNETLAEMKNLIEKL